MLTSLEIENFKCFRQLKIEPLAKVNLFVGTSNSGKTSVLEAVSMLPQTEGVRLPEFRDPALTQGKTLESVRWLFHDLDLSQPISVQAGYARGVYIAQIANPGQGRKLSQEVQSLPGGKVLSWHPSSPSWTLLVRSLTTDKRPAEALARDFDYWTRRTVNEERIVEFMSKIEPRLKGLRPFEIEGRRMLYADVRLPERIALPLLGEGFNRLVQIYGAIIGEGADIVLIDEIENGLHWSALPQIWTGIREAVNKEEVQIFATTHSLECIAAAAAAFKGEPKNDLAVHRLERAENGDIRCVTMNEDELERMLERDWEVR